MIVAQQNRLLRLLKLIALLKQAPPKSIHFIAEFLDTSTRTAYRYVKLLEEVNFNISVDDFNKYSIREHPIHASDKFNAREIGFLKELVHTTSKEHPLNKSILHKLNLIADAEHADDDLLNARMADMISRINKAINGNYQLILKQYQSISSQNITDRLVEPIKFTSHYRSVCAFEVASQQNKFFNLERIGSIESTEQPQRYEHWHRFKKPDVFGFSKNDREYQVDLLLSLKAKLLLTEEYPFTKAYVWKIDDDTYAFKAKIYDAKPLQRFYSGLSDDIKVLPGTEIDLNTEKKDQN